MRAGRSLKDTEELIKDIRELYLDENVPIDIPESIHELQAAITQIAILKHLVLHHLIPNYLRLIDQQNGIRYWPK